MIRLILFYYFRSLFWRFEISNLWMMSKSSIVLWKWEVPNWQPIRLKQVVQCGILKEISIPKALFQLLRLKSSLIFLTRNLWSQSFTSLKANLCQNINGGFVFLEDFILFSCCSSDLGRSLIYFDGAIPSRNCSFKSWQRFVIIEVNEKGP